MSRELGRWLWAVALAAGLMCAPARADERTRDLLHVRSLNSVVRTVLADAAAQSPTLAGLLAEIESSDVIVYITVEPLPTEVIGGVNFVQEAGGYRYLRVSVRPDLTRIDLAALLGHELQHVVEVARATYVRTAAAMQIFYGNIGDCVGDGYHDTKDARDTGKQVRQELVNPTPQPTPLR